MLDEVMAFYIPMFYLLLGCDASFWPCTTHEIYVPSSQMDFRCSSLLKRCSSAILAPLMCFSKFRTEVIVLHTPELLEGLCYHLTHQLSTTQALVHTPTVVWGRELKKVKVQELKDWDKYSVIKFWFCFPNKQVIQNAVAHHQLSNA